MTWQTTGFIQQKKIFESLIEQDVLSHAYIFQGPEQIGKKLFAQDLFVKANKREKFDVTDPDLFMIAPRVTEGDTKIYIEDIRDLKKFLSLRPYYGPYQFAIIDDAHRLTPEASNAFLKLLEEPTGKVIFVLITSQPQELLQTISSRGQHISFLSHSDKVVTQSLATTKLSKTDQELVTALDQGRIGWAIMASEKGNIKDIKQAVTDFGVILKSPLAERMLFAKNLIEKQPYQEQINYWLAWAYTNRATLPNAHHVLSQLLMLHQYINQPQYNHRALLENTLINL
jgi:replication-associated recombination protein RarA